MTTLHHAASTFVELHEALSPKHKTMFIEINVMGGFDWSIDVKTSFVITSAPIDVEINRHDATKPTYRSSTGEFPTSSLEVTFIDEIFENLFVGHIVIVGNIMTIHSVNDSGKRHVTSSIEQLKDVLSSTYHKRVVTYVDGMPEARKSPFKQFFTSTRSKPRFMLDAPVRHTTNS